MTFEELGLSKQTIKAIKELGITRPTTVQKDVIPSVLEGRDIFAIAPGRCGKTCSYVFPLIDIISRKQGQNILIVTADSKQSVVVSDRLAVFNKYHEINEETGQEDALDALKEANVIIASPDLLLDIVAEGKVDLSEINILIVDDINLLKKKRQLGNLEKILDMLPADKQNIVFTNRRSKETQDILDKILKTPAEIKVDRAKEDEAAAESSSGESENVAEAGGKETKPVAEVSKKSSAEKNEKQSAAVVHEPKTDEEAVSLMEQYKTFGDKTPAFLLYQGELAKNEY